MCCDGVPSPEGFASLLLACYLLLLLAAYCLLLLTAAAAVAAGALPFESHLVFGSGKRNFIYTYMYE